MITQRMTLDLRVIQESKKPDAYKVKGVYDQQSNVELQIMP